MITMLTKVIKIGNSLGLIIPKPLMKEMGWKVGTELYFRKIANGSILMYEKGTTGVRDMIKFYKSVNEVEKRYAPMFEELAKNRILSQKHSNKI